MEMIGEFRKNKRKIKKKEIAEAVFGKYNKTLR